MLSKEEIQSIIQKYKLGKNKLTTEHSIGYSKEWNATVFTVYGGENSGNGKWSEYFEVMSKLVKELEQSVDEVIVFEVNADYDDDVFAVDIGIR